MSQKPPAMALYVASYACGSTCCACIVNLDHVHVVMYLLSVYMSTHITWSTIVSIGSTCRVNGFNIDDCCVLTFSCPHSRVMLLSYSGSVEDGIVVVSDNLSKFRECIDPVWHQCRTLVSTSGTLMIVVFCNCCLQATSYRFSVHISTHCVSKPTGMMCVMITFIGCE